MKLKIYIENEGCFLDKDVSVEVELSAIPRIGESVLLSRIHKDELEEKAKSSISIAQRYAPQWFYYRSNGIAPEDIKPENLADLGFEDAMHVKTVTYIEGNEFVHLSINDTYEEHK